jgi:hypothetical protein
LAKWFVQQYSSAALSAYIHQLSEEDTKTMLIGGPRIVNGSTQTVTGLVAHICERGGIGIFDELAHAEHDVQLLYNTPTERSSKIALGDYTIARHPLARFVFATNDDNLAGNHSIAQSLGRRLKTLPFEYPCFESEVDIALSIVRDDLEDTRDITPPTLHGSFPVPESVACFLVSYVREMRQKNRAYPLAASNVAMALHDLSVEDELTGTGHVLLSQEPPFSAQATEAMYKRIYRRIHPAWPDPKGSDELLEDPACQRFVAFVSRLGKDRFTEAVLTSVGYYTPLAGLGPERDAFRQELKTALL